MNIGVDADLIYFNEQTGIKISKFIEDAQTLRSRRSEKAISNEKDLPIIESTSSMWA